MKTIEQFKHDCLQVIEFYQSDLNYDLEILNAGWPALFFAYKCGSHAIVLHPFESYPPGGDTVPYLFGRADRWHILHQVKSLLECESVKNAPLIHYFDGRRIKLIDIDKAISIVEHYHQSMSNRFRKDNGLRAA